MTATEFDVYAHRQLATFDELCKLPEGLYLVKDPQTGEVQRRIHGTPARLLARVRRTWSRVPGRVHKVYLRKDSLQIIMQWEDEEGAWPEDAPPSKVLDVDAGYTPERDADA